MSVFKSVTVCGFELAVAPSFGCVYAAADRNGAIYGYQNLPTPVREEGHWLDTLTGNRVQILPANMVSLKRGEWLKTLSKVLDID